MKPDKLVLMVSEDCNFHCHYCYHTPQKKEMSRETAEEALDFFLPRMPDPAGLYFLGGEPLLNAGLIKAVIENVDNRTASKRKTCRYHISTNGSLIDEDILEFFSDHRFTVELSFDSLVQDVGRKKGSFQPLVGILGQLNKSRGISLMVNTVFYPPTVRYLSESLRFLLDLEVPHLSLGLELDQPWESSAIDTFEYELHQLMESLIDHVMKTGYQPLHFFPDLDAHGIWGCSAGQNQLTVTADGEIWGCVLFHEYFKRKRDRSWYRDYCFGTLDEFIRNHKKIYPEIMDNYKQLSQDNFHTENSRCFRCPEIEKCGVCPVSSAFCLGDPEQVPGHICRINRIAIREQQKFLRRLEKIE
jgi:sulfatase maturation enzyme AslB (radical SAM superfamily)